MTAATVVRSGSDHIRVLDNKDTSGCWTEPNSGSNGSVFTSVLAQQKPTPQKSPLAKIRRHFGNKVATKTAVTDIGTRGRNVVSLLCFGACIVDATPTCLGDS